MKNAIKSGRAFNGAERDRGIIVHLVEDDSFPSWQKSMCGTEPGRRGNGWHHVEREVTCEKCLKKYKKIMEEKKDYTEDMKSAMRDMFKDPLLSDEENEHVITETFKQLDFEKMNQEIHVGISNGYSFEAQMEICAKLIRLGK